MRSPGPSAPTFAPLTAGHGSGRPVQPLLLVDVDGVISLWGFDLDARPPGSFVVVDGIPHFLAEQAGRHLRALVGAYELVWCTGWEEKANEVLPHAIGVGPLPYLSFDAVPGTTPAHWKLPAIDAYAGPRRPLAWVDDAHDEACERWARERPGPTLLVGTDPALGLTAREAAVLRDWRG